ncbi:LysR family transcriptional regulator [Gordonia sp. TBRC 11910]|uniref:LysR family transcriptional regulator n=1 Tax=Gordonia asplenii TaxID=2725283 RepID=A0A848L2S1_9ACTN|nr:LysR family transcriptional regulator [Gordonia asplenii]NMO02903.1 LysR family transcriptional regulator [Gordonia asplenii]
MDSRHIEFFVAVAEELNFTRAAARVNAVQSTVSAGIVSLEREVGAELFRRSTRRVELTAEGRDLLPHARRLLTEAESIRDVGQQARRGLRGRVRIGVISNLEMLDIPSALGAFHRDHPKVELSIAVRPRGSSDIVDDVRAGRLDLGFSGLPPDDDGLRYLHVSAQRMVVVLPRDHRLATAGRIGLADLVDEPCVDMPAGFGTRVLVEQHFDAARLHRTVALEVPDLTTVPDYVAAGLGIAIVPQHSAARRSDIVVRPLAEEIVWDLHLVSKPRVRPNRAVDALIGHLLS